MPSHNVTIKERRMKLAELKQTKVDSDDDDAGLSELDKKKKVLRQSARVVSKKEMEVEAEHNTDLERLFANQEEMLQRLGRIEMELVRVAMRLDAGTNKSKQGDEE